MFQCQFCSNIFVTKKILNHHQLNVKYCLKIQQAKEEYDAKALVEAKENEKKELEAQAESKKVETTKLQQTTSELTCRFCSKQFKTKSHLSNHQTEAKYCLKIQESQNSEEIIASLVTCKFCEKNFSSRSFKRHDSSCKKKIQYLTEEIARMKTEKDQEIARMKTEKDQEISRMKIEKAEEIGLIYKIDAERAHATIEEIAKQPTYQKNNTRNIQNNLMISSLTPLDLAQARVDSIIDEKYTKNDFYGGQKAVAQVIHKYLTTDSNGKSQIVCTDTERGTFHHIDVNGEHVVDYKNRDLIEKVHLPLKRKACEFAAEEYVKNPSASKEIITSENSIRELESKPGLFNRTMAQLTGKNCAKQLITTNEQQPDLSIIEELLLENEQQHDLSITEELLLENEQQHDLSITEELLLENEQQPDLSITEEWLLENAKFLTIEHILRGSEGYADYALEYPLRDRLIINDEYYDSKQKPTFLKFKDINGDIIIDNGGKILTKMFFDSISERIMELIENKSNYFNQIENNSNLIDEFIDLVMNNI